MNTLTTVAYATYLLSRSAVTIVKIAVSRGVFRRKPAQPSWSIPMEIMVRLVGIFSYQMTRVSPRFIPTGPREPYVAQRVDVRALTKSPFPTMDEHRLKKNAFLGHTDTAAIRKAMGEEGLLLYFHGGGYTAMSPKVYRNIVGQLCVHSGKWALVPDYPLAPQSPYQAALDHVLAIYKQLLADGVPSSSIIVGGDSAGGNLSLVFTFKLKELGLPLPKKLLLLSPWVDLAVGEKGTNNDPNSSYVINRPYDYLGGHLIPIVAEMYAPKMNKMDPNISPIHADFKAIVASGNVDNSGSSSSPAFPPTMIVTGGAEIFRDENRILAASMRAAGIDVVYDEVPEMVHVFPMLAALHQSAADALVRIGEFLSK